MKNEKKVVWYFLLLFIGLAATTYAQTPEPVGPVPNERQIEWFHREIIAFFHFGINTFGENVNEGDGKASPTLFNPTVLDCNQWMRVLKSAGIPCGILTAKHADGFCNWLSAYTDYSVKNSPWRNYKGDLVREFTDACKKAGIKAGLYLGPHDRHQHLSPTYSTEGYGDYYASQLSELLRNYGTIWETWWDGAGADELTSDLYTRWADTVRTLQPKCVIFGTKNSSAFADVRWVGNESGIAGNPCWSTINLSSIKNEAEHIFELNHGEINGEAYVPAETDVSIRPSWFYHESENSQVKSIETLWDIYCNSVGHNSVLLLNFAPDRRGLITPADSANAAGLKALIDNTFKNNLAEGASVTAIHQRGEGFSPSNLVDTLESTYYSASDHFKTDTLVFALNSEKTFDCLMLQEVIELGHRTTGWSVDFSTDGTNWKLIPEATDLQSIGYKWIVRFKPVAASHVRLRITAGKACPAIHTFGIYKQHHF